MQGELGTTQNFLSLSLQILWLRSGWPRTKLRQGKNKEVRHFFADIYVTLINSFTFVY